ncbi:MAG: hypothetical protein WAV45_02470, partial [Propionibacteriaceae bacterium]
MENVTQLLLVLVVGLILGGSVAWLILRASRGTDGAEASRQIAESRTEAEQARADAANARAEAANA